MKTHRKEAIGVLSKYIKSDDPDALQEAYESIGLNLVPEKPYPTMKGIQIILREMGAKDAAARSARPEQFVDTSIIKELDSSGFIDRLYKSAACRQDDNASWNIELPQRPLNHAGRRTQKQAAGNGRKAKTHSKTSPPPRATKPRPALRRSKSAGSQQYTVKAGDTLSKLAGQFYNATEKWDRIYDANRDQLKNPNYIYIGMKLMIPSDDKAS